MGRALPIPIVFRGANSSGVSHSLSLDTLCGVVGCCSSIPVVEVVSSAVVILLLNLPRSSRGPFPLLEFGFCKKIGLLIFFGVLSYLRPL